jgi:hypothetical protein
MSALSVNPTSVATCIFPIVAEQTDANLVGAGDDVVAGQNLALGIDQKTGAERQ